jgi:hypothetical protein
MKPLSSGTSSKLGGRGKALKETVRFRTLGLSVNNAPLHLLQYFDCHKRIMARLISACSVLAVRVPSVWENSPPCYIDVVSECNTEMMNYRAPRSLETDVCVQASC